MIDSAKGGRGLGGRGWRMDESSGRCEMYLKLSELSVSRPGFSRRCDGAKYECEWHRQVEAKLFVMIKMKRVRNEIQGFKEKMKLDQGDS